MKLVLFDLEMFCKTCGRKAHLCFREDYSGMKIVCGWCGKEEVVFDLSEDKFPVIKKKEKQGEGK